jgi:hypothetical protein
MKRLGLALIALFAVGLVVNSGYAKPDYKKAVDQKWGESKIAEVVKAEKCNLCHYGTTKKNRNDLGSALIKCGLTPEKYDELKADKEKLVEFALEVLGKVEGEKSSKGKTFGELIKAGEDPSTDPEVKEEQ